jgi:glycerophosphoryl diester phosphodiesterase
MRAFAAAIEAGVDHIETDVQVASDGEVVIFHDETLDQATTGRGRVADHPWSRLQQLRYRDGGEVTPDGLVRLADALDRWPHVAFNIDVKVDEAVDPVVSILRARNAESRVCLAAFGFRRLSRLRAELGSGWCFAFSQPEIFLARIFAWLGLPIPRRGDVVQVPERHRGVTVVDRRFVEACHRRGIACHVWTVNDADTMSRLWELGVDAVITDQPEVALERSG